MAVHKHVLARLNEKERTAMPAEKWEYWSGFLWADIEDKNVKEFIQQRWPDWKKPPRFTPQAMMPALNVFGEQGWELVHMEPVAAVGEKGDVLFGGAPGRPYSWSNAYFCVFKRRKW